MTFQNRLRHLRLGDSYSVAYHSTDTTNISNVPLKKLLSHTTTNDELTVYAEILKIEQVVYHCMARDGI